MPGQRSLLKRCSTGISCEAVVSRNQDFEPKESVINKAQKAEEELGVQEAELRSIVSLTPQMLAALDPDGRVTWANEFVLDYFGISLADLRADNLGARLFHPDDVQRLNDERQSAFARGMPFEIEQRMRGKDGKYRWFLVRYRPLKDPEGRVHRWYGGATDIEDRKQAEEALHRAVAEADQRRSEAVAEQHRFSDLVNSVEGIVWEADAETFVFSFVSEQAERILGYPVAQWLREATFWKDHLHPEDRERAVRFCVRATAEKRSHDFEYRMIAADGRMVWLRDLVTVVVENGRATRLRGVMIDITKRKQDEEARRQQANLLNITHDAIFVRDLNASIKYWNRAAEEMYGWTAEEASGKLSHRLLKTVFPIPLEQIEAHLMRTDRWEGELVHTRKDGTPLVVASRWALQRDEKGTPIAILETNYNITEHKEAEQARQNLEEQWKAAFESNPTMYFIIGAAGEIVSVNAFGAEQLGYTVSELVGQPVLSVFYEADRDAVQKHANDCSPSPAAR